MRRLKKAVMEAMRGDRCTVVRIEGGYRVEVWRGEARLKFDVYPGSHVDCVHLAAPAKTGWTKDANKLVRKVLGPQFGVRYVEITANTERAAATFSKYAPYEQVGPATWRWTLDG